MLEFHMNTYNSKWWSTNYPSSWVSEEEKDCHSFYNNDGVGALQVSAYKKENGEVNNSELISFIEGYTPSDISLEQIYSGDFQGFYCHFISDEEYWKYWILKAGGLMLFITYNCAEDDKGIEDQEIDIITKNIKKL